MSVLSGRQANSMRHHTLGPARCDPEAQHECTVAQHECTDGDPDHSPNQLLHCSFPERLSDSEANPRRTCHQSCTDPSRPIGGSVTTSRSLSRAVMRQTHSRAAATHPPPEPHPAPHQRPRPGQATASSRLSTQSRNRARTHTALRDGRSGHTWRVARDGHFQRGAWRPTGRTSFRTEICDSVASNKSYRGFESDALGCCRIWRVRDALVPM